MKQKQYEHDLRMLQIELCKMQRHIAEQNQRLCIVFEGRDTAGKGGSIKRIIMHLPPREVRTVALPKPTERERDSWYFQRYIPHLPAKGEIVLFDRSWYNRAGVEPVMGFCNEEQHQNFLNAAPKMEEMLAKDGIHLIKFWLDISRTEQGERLNDRAKDPLKTWKLSPMDAEAQKRWDAYSAARNSMLQRSDHAKGRWSIVNGMKKRTARLAIMRHILQQVEYADCNHDGITPADDTVQYFDPKMIKDGRLHP